LMVLPSRMWKRMTSSRWGAAFAVVVFVFGAWLATTGMSRKQPATSGRSGNHSVASGTPRKQPAASHSTPASEPIAAGQEESSPGSAGHSEHGAAAPQEHAAAGEHAASGEHSGESSGPEKFPNVITVLERANPNAKWAQFLHRFEAVIFSTLIALILCV